MKTFTLDYARWVYVVQHDSGDVEELKMSKAAEHVAASMEAKGYLIKRVYEQDKSPAVAAPVMPVASMTQDDTEANAAAADVVTTTELAAALGVTAQRIFQMVKEGKVAPVPMPTGYVFGGRQRGLLFNRSEVERLARRAKKTKTPRAEKPSVIEKPSVEERPAMGGFEALNDVALVTLGGLVNALADIAGHVGVDVGTLTTAQLCEVLGAEAARRTVGGHVSVRVQTEGQQLVWAARHQGVAK